MVEKIKEITGQIQEDHAKLVKRYNEVVEEENKLKDEKATLEVNLHRLSGAMSVVQLLSTPEELEEVEAEIVEEK